MTLDGHVKVADYGLCKESIYHGQTTSTFCGTPEFMAPEILLEQKYGTAVDWWAFGVLIYEMLLGQSPFRGDDEDEIFDAILEDEPLYPIHMPRDSVAILEKVSLSLYPHMLNSLTPFTPPAQRPAEAPRIRPLGRRGDQAPRLLQGYQLRRCPAQEDSASVLSYDRQCDGYQQFRLRVHQGATYLDTCPQSAHD